MKVYSVKVLIEATIVPDDDTKTFEEVIVLVEALNYDDIEAKIHKHFVDHTYENALGGQITWSLVRILDIFETVDIFEGDINFKEVYSRFLEFDRPITADEVIELYSLDK